jgi:molybdenum cofactor cytidylyltransferase
MSDTAVVLAAGSSSRMGAQKLLLDIGGRPMLARALEACSHLPTVAVISEAARPALAGYPAVRIVVNDAPERGMAHSLRLADAAIDPAESLLVLLGDKPLVSQPLVDAIRAARDGADVCYPVAHGISGHPVAFSPKARTFIAAVPDGESLHGLRDQPSLTRRALPIDDPGAYADVDDPAALREITRESSY